MKITEILIESQQLDEGPFGTAVGKFAGGVAKGVGAVAGGVAGMGKAFKKGFSSGKATVAGDPDPNDEPAAAEKPAAGGAQQPALTGGPTAGLPPAAEPVGPFRKIFPAENKVSVVVPNETEPPENIRTFSLLFTDNAIG